MLQAALLGLAAGLSGYLLLTTILEAPARGAGARRRRVSRSAAVRPGGFPGGAERKIVAQFDKNGDGRLDTAERKAARESLAAEPAGRGFGRRGGPGGFGRGGMAPGIAWTQAEAGRRQVLSATQPLYDPATLRTIFLQFENADWEQELAAFNNTDVEVPAVADGRRQDLQGRRRALPRHARLT